MDCERDSDVARVVSCKGRPDGVGDDGRAQGYEMVTGGLLNYHVNGEGESKQKEMWPRGTEQK